MYKKELRQEPSYFVPQTDSQLFVETSYQRHLPAQTRASYPHADSFNFSPLQTARLDKTGNLIHISVSEFSGMQPEQGSKAGEDLKQSSVYDSELAPPPFCSATEPQYFGSARNLETFLTPNSSFYNYPSERTVKKEEKRSTLLINPNAEVIVPHFNEPAQTPVFPKFSDDHQRSFGIKPVFASPKIVNSNQVSGLPAPSYFNPDPQPYFINIQKEPPRTSIEYPTPATEKNSIKLRTQPSGEFHDLERDESKSKSVAQATEGANKMLQIVKSQIKAAFEFNALMAYCLIDAILFFILSKTTANYGIMSHYTMLLALAMSFISLMPGIAKIRYYALQAYLGIDLLVVLVGIVQGLIAVYPAFAISPSFFGILYNSLFILEYFLAFLSLFSCLLILAFTWPLFQQINAIKSDL